ncbi:glycosyltransferase [Cellulosimicrobium sp. PMB13]|uniref:glycosyltransferase n=1 Tax=Cellulosimicrobium sp. PMB13 TaxID=3120158 RepID=UPI003F4B62D2
MARVLVSVFTVANWGGLHENTLATVRALRNAGHEVDVVCKKGPFADACSGLGAQIIETDWADPVHFARAVADSGVRPDIVYASPQASRIFGLEISRLINCPLYVMFHGYYADGAAYWRGDVRKFAGVSPSIVELLTGYCAIDPWRVEMIPNGILDEYLDAPRRPLSDKLSTGTGRVVSAGRLESDKVAQREVFSELVPALAERRGVSWEIIFLGDGDERGGMEEFLGALTGQFSNVSFRFSGWVSPTEVERITRRATFSVGAGRFAALSMATGTPCFGVGKHGSAGLQYGSNLGIGAWSNFGDYPLRKAVQEVTPIASDVGALLESDYAAIADDGWHFVSRTRRQSKVDGETLEFLDL